MTHERLEPRRFGPQHRASERQQVVVATPLVFLAGRSSGIRDQPQLDQPGDSCVERAGSRPERAVGPLRDVLDQRVAVSIPVGQGEQDVELMRRQRKKALWIVHASNLDISTLDGVA